MLLIPPLILGYICTTAEINKIPFWFGFICGVFVDLFSFLLMFIRPFLNGTYEDRSDILYTGKQCRRCSNTKCTSTYCANYD